MPHPDTGEVLWFDPDPRAIIPLDGFHVSKSLKKSLRTRGYTVSFDTAFQQVVLSCAQRSETWINQDFKSMYQEMYKLGVAHSVEVWLDDKLVGGVFGLKFGGVFNGESMFSTATDASKVALYSLVKAMRIAKMTVLEVQFMTPHLKSLGAVGVSRAEYHKLIEQNVNLEVSLLPEHFRGPLF
jgi:leucyl/phenylalanyl-tRNA--protein transferase